MERDIKLYRRLLTLLLGIALITFGGTQMIVDLRGDRPLSDEAVIERAKALGMVEMKDVYQEDMKDGKLDLTKPDTSKE